MSDPETQPGTESEVERPRLAPEEFLTWRSPRLGTANPTDLTNTLWVWMARSWLLMFSRASLSRV